MKRHLLIIGICLLVGAVVNVAVAWGIVGWLPIDAEGRALFPGWALSDTAPPCWIFTTTTRIYINKGPSATYASTTRPASERDSLVVMGTAYRADGGEVVRSGRGRRKRSVFSGC